MENFGYEFDKSTYIFGSDLSDRIVVPRYRDTTSQRDIATIIFFFDFFLNLN